MDPYLKALMEGQLNKKPVKPNKDADKFDLAAENEIEKYLKTVNFDENPQNLQLVTPAMKRAKLKEELKDKAHLNELRSYFATALQTIQNESKQILSSEENERLLTDLNSIVEKLNQIQLETSPDDQIDTLLSISDLSCNALIKLGATKYAENNLSSSLAIFVLLASFYPYDAEYWFRIGMIAQEMENFDLAFRAYENASNCDPDFIGPSLFAAQCHLTQKNIDKAREKYLEAKQIAERIEIPEEWKDVLNRTGEALKG